MAKTHAPKERRLFNNASNKQKAAVHELWNAFFTAYISSLKRADNSNWKSLKSTKKPSTPSTPDSQKYNAPETMGQERQRKSPTIGTIDYTVILSQNVHMESRLLTRMEAFLQRMGNYGPLEGPAPDIENYVTATGMKRRFRPLYIQKSFTKVSTVKALCNKVQVIWLLDFVPF
jgi:hypothetical protein